MARYIDADFLINAINDADIITDTAKFIRDFPTADVRENIHAHWELDEEGWYCSACKLYPPFDCDPEEKGIRFCPNCGAVMDERKGGTDV